MRLFGATFLLLFSVPAAAQSGFYEERLAQGIAAYQKASYPAAIAKLTVAAFGAVDNLGAYERAQAYLALAADRMHDEPAARAAVERLIAAEKLQPHYAELSASERAAVDPLVDRFGRRADLQAATAAAQLGTRTVPAPIEKPRPLAPPPSTVAPRPVASPAVAATAAVPRPVTPAPSTPTPKPVASPAVAAVAGTVPVLRPAPSPAAQPAPRSLEATAEQNARAHAGTKFTLAVSLLCEASSLRTTLANAPPELWFVASEYHGRSCWRVYWGSFETLAAARAAIPRVPRSLTGGATPVVVDRRK